MKNLFAAAGAASVLLAGTASAQTVLPPAQQGVPYSASLTPAILVSPSYTAAVLPAGLSLSGTTISGTPTVAGTHDFTVNATGTRIGSCTSGAPTYVPVPCPTDTQVQNYRLQVSPAPAPVPTLSEWAMILLGVLLAGGAALTIQRRRAV